MLSSANNHATYDPTITDLHDYTVHDPISALLIIQFCSAALIIQFGDFCFVYICTYACNTYILTGVYTHNRFIRAINQFKVMSRPTNSSSVTTGVISDSGVISAAAAPTAVGVCKVVRNIRNRDRTKLKRRQFANLRFPFPAFNLLNHKYYWQQQDS